MLIGGAGGFARELLELILQTGYQKEIRFFDNVNTTVQSIHDQYQVLHSFQEAEDFFKQHAEFVLGVGDGKLREKFYEQFLSVGGIPITIVSPFAHIGKHGIQLGKGVCIATASILTTGILLGDGCLVNLNCTIGHDVTLGDFVTLAPGVHISGNCLIGHHSTIGTGAVILPGIKIGEHAVVGAGAVVTKDVADGETVTGIPAKAVNQNHSIS
jgi:sugar O-acyltransferase (sialic acid O-acetyltransferase NeuD family)